MSCRKGWSREILVANFTQKFVSRTYKERRENLLFEREKSMMPATLPYVEIEKEIRKISTAIAHAKNERDMVGIRWRQISNITPAVHAVQVGFTTEFDASVDIHRMMFEERKKHTSRALDIEHLEWTQNQLIQRLHGGSLELEKRQFVRACPWAECRGFLSTAWRCGVCDNWTCPECHEVKGPNKDAPHTCDPNSVATAKLLAKDSRGCPKCSAMIFKINGCDQMYCTQCHTAFSWRTGRIETGTIHNPHYYDYMRARGTLARNPGDVPCGGLPDWNIILQIMRLSPQTRSIEVCISSAHRAWGHIQYWVLGRYTVNALADNRDLRIKFILGDLNEDDFKKKIQQREKARQRKTDIRQVLDMNNAVLVDLFQAFVHNKGVQELYSSLVELKTHVNSTLSNVSKRYGKCAVPVIRDFYDVS